MKQVSYVNGVAQALSQDFINAWRLKQGKGGQVLVRAKRRYWDGAAFVLEADWQQFLMGNFVEVGNITWKLDSPLLNEFKTSSVPIKFRGSMYQMLPTNVGSKGFFAPDDVAPAGYEPFLTQFQVQFGYKLPSGDYELVNLFTGVAIDYLFDVQGGYTEVTVSGNEALMQYSDAQLVSTPLTGAATTNTGTNQYTTNHTGIGKIYAVYANGVLKTQGTDYQISGTDSYNSGAVITFGAPVSAPVTYDGTAWLTLKKIEDLVLLLAIQAGITSYSISPVVWASGQGVITDIGKFSGSSWSPTWTQQAHNAGGGVSAAGGAITCYSSGTLGIETLDTPCTPNIGTFSMGLTINAASAPGSSNSNDGLLVMFLMPGHPDMGSGVPKLTGYGLFFNLNTGGGAANQVQLVRMDNINQTFGGVVLANCGAFSADAVRHAWAVTRDAAGNMSVFKDGAVVGATVTPDNTYTTNAYFCLSAITVNSSGSISITADSIQNTTEIFLTMANFSGMTCYDALQKLAKLANYEFGFDADGALFFRPKSPTAVPANAPAYPDAVVHINQNDKLAAIRDFRFGYADIVNVAQVNYGSYYRQYDSTIAGEAAPTSEQRYLQHIQPEDYTDFLLAWDPMIAASRAQSLRDSQYRGRRRERINVAIVPFLDLSDVVSFSFFNNPRLADNIFGDPLEKWGESSFGLPSNVLARALKAKAIGLVLNPNDCTEEIELQEILP